jgi:hypothetical protein
MTKPTLIFLSLVLTLALGLAATSPDRGGWGQEAKNQLPADAQVGQAFQVPYRLTDTNHFLVRVRINGKGPFNFLVDSGAPALYVATETARKIGLEPARNAFWTPIDRLEFEGGARLRDVKARVEDPFQLVGMNALGLPGASIDGILGFTILARFRLEIDPSQDRMIWTRLDFAPPDPPVPPLDGKDAHKPPPEMQVMNALGPVAKGLAFFMGKQPEEERHPRGFLGVEWTQARDPGADHATIRVHRVIERTPAAEADIKSGDTLVRIQGKAVADLEAVRQAVALVRPGEPVELVLRRVPEGGNQPAAGPVAGKESGEQTVTIIAGEGL